MTIGPTGMAGSGFVCSWSGGKDSTLALHRALEAGGRARRLLTMMTEGGLRTRSHGLPIEVIRTQARALGVPLLTRSASWDTYEDTFVSALRSLRAEVEFGVFGDIDIEHNREWEQKVCVAAGLRAYLPLWGSSRRPLLEEFIQLGYTAVVVAVNGRVLPRSFLGRTLDTELVHELRAAGVDPAGEMGEYHTVVTGGPIFREPLRLDLRGQEEHDGYWFQDVAVVY